MNEDKNKAKNIEKSEVAKQEEKVLQFWQENKIFEKSLEQTEGKEQFVFYDGPPFATGLPHYGHILAGTIKDILPRYQTMLGKKVSRRWGWDCHGLPIENLIEDELGLKTKQDIYEHGVGKFNQCAKDSVLRYDKEWQEIVPRTGRWIDMENSYKTMDTSYSESIWWIFKTIYDKGLIYEGHKAMHLCPRCETTLSNFEVNQGYEDIKDISVTVEFELENEENVFVLAWTTTPWTLPGNVALAVNSDIDYVKIEKEDEGGEGKVKFVVAKERLEKIFEGSKYEVIEEFKGSELVGKAYKPAFDYYSNQKDLENKENGWKIYEADFVTTEDGTGIVHIAPAFGSDDMELGQKENLPFVQHVTVDGKFTKEVKDFVGEYVKPKDDHQKADVEIIKYLAGKDVLFAKEKVEHSYPHCWRCHTPLLNYATSSWFLKVTEIKDKLIKVNQGIKWVPENMRDGRFGKWLEGARDWAISRSRFWGAPLPVWQCADCNHTEVIGSIDDIKKKKKSINKYFVMRHGEAESNTLNIISTKKDNPHHLTEKGKEQVRAKIDELKKQNIDLIISSPFIRTTETAEIIADGIGYDKKEIVFDSQIEEIKLGEFEGKNIQEIIQFFTSQKERFSKIVPGGETMTDVKKRAGNFLYEINEKYSNKNILIVTHSATFWMLVAASEGLDVESSVKIKKQSADDCFSKNAELRELDFSPIPHNKNYEVDLHMPYIDEVEFECECGKKMKRIPEVFDCWFESGSMPYASNHYPFENLDKFNPEKGIGFPADFIAEGTDQTRGWFYTSLVLSTALFEKTSFENVIVNGMVMAEDGKKMSKSLKNYPEVDYILDKYGADAMRYYMISSPIVRAEDLNFSEKGVDEIMKKIIFRTKNVLFFYNLYKKDLGPGDLNKNKNVLDKWIVARLNELIGEVTTGLDNYELDRASRPIMDFVDDLSTWYLRRSRERLKDGDENALATTRFVLQELSKVMAPFMPFLAEQIWQSLQLTSSSLRGEAVAIQEKISSIHLQKWPEIQEVDQELLEEMQKVRNIVSLALEARAKEGIKVRQPLAKLTAHSSQLTADEGDLIQIIKDEVNVKEVVFEEGDEMKVELDTNLTSELKAEGNFRELLRNVQRMRKEAKLVPSEVVNLIIETSDEGKALINQFETELKKVAGIKNIKLIQNERGTDAEQTQKDSSLRGEAVAIQESKNEKIKIDNLEFKLKIEK